MALIYVKCGQYENAIDELEELLAEQTDYTVNDLKLNIALEPLSNIPRYQELLRNYASVASAR